MGIISNALRELIAAGVTGEELVESIARIEDAPKTKSAGAVRQARYRERLASRVTSQTTNQVAIEADINAAWRLIASGLSGAELAEAVYKEFPEARPSHVTSVTSRDACDVTPPPPSSSPFPPSSPPTPPLITPLPPFPSTPPASLRSAARARAISYPHDFIPTKHDNMVAKSIGMSDDRITEELEHFKDHAIAKGKTYVDWHAAWRNWVRSPYQQSPYQQPTGGNGNGPHKKSLGEVAREVCDRLDEVAGEKTGENLDWLLPKG